MLRFLKSAIPLLLILALWLYYTDREKRNDYFRYPTEKFSGTLNFSYQDVTTEMEITHRTHSYVPSPQLENYFALGPAVDYVAVGDLDNDGYSDLVFTTADPADPIKIYKSINGKKFESVENEWGLGEEKKKGGVVYAVALFDYNNDGWLDIYVARDGCHDLYENLKGHGFRSVGKETGVSKICNKRVTGISVLDYNHDGYLDLYFTRLFGDTTTTGNDNGVTYFIPRINKASPGAGKNFMVQNIGGKEMKVVPDIGLDNGWLAWAAGITDINDDGYPDIIVANDFSINQVYINNKNGTFSRQTRPTLGMQYNSANMSVETGDYNNDGKIDFYVSNVSRSTFAANQYNYLFQKTEPGHFQNKSLDLGVDRCGWSWGAKFIDPNLDGKLDLMVVNGFFNDGPKPYWYKWAVYGSLPQYIVNSPNVMPPSRGHSMEGEQPNCLFLQNDDGHFVNVAPEAGITDLQNGRGLAVIDLENKGHFDLVIANHNAAPIIYKETLKNTDNNWVGLHLRAKDKNIFAIGAKVVLKTANQVHAYEHYPTNGFSSKSHDGIIFGLGKETAFSIDVHWPSGVQKTYDHLTINQYNTLEE